MRCATVILDGREQAAIMGNCGWIPISRINTGTKKRFPEILGDLIATDCRSELGSHLREMEDVAVLSIDDMHFGPPLRRPGKIWGIGLNYQDHAADLDEKTPEQPASFMKPATAVIGPEEVIWLPRLAKEVTAEGELGIIIGSPCRKLSLAEAREDIFGFTTVIDMTALDILKQNPRYLTRAKSFNTFFRFGPEVITADEIDDLEGLTVRTVVNGRTRASNTVSNMTFSPLELVRYHSHVMTLEPGDVISTGTLGAWIIHPGDRVRCEITGFTPLENRVVEDAD